MLAELKLANFRIFNDEVTVRFRPITLLIGRNSSGKSSIIKFLLMLQQSGPGNPHFLNPEGNKVNLGIFSELKNSLTRKRNLSFEVAAKSDTASPGLSLFRLLGLPEDVDHSNLLYKTNATVSYNRKAGIGRASYYLTNEISGETLVRADITTLDDSTLWDYPRLSDSFEASPALEDTKESHDSMKERIERGQAVLIRRMADFEVVNVLRHQIDSIRHLSPVRDESLRVIVSSSPPYDNVGQRGQYALPHLQQMVTEERGRYEFILPHLGSVTGIEGMKFKTSSRYVTQAFAKNKITGADVLIADYGFGVSQCLPIFVQGAVMSPYTTLMVEQPEAQLHPTAQLEMGSYFADLWKYRNVGTIIETHSGNILLRLRRLIAKGELSHLDVSVGFFTFDEQRGNAPLIKNLDINEDGSMQPGLPMEFFGADVIEGLRLGARA